ncbi:MAG: AlpA family phage regulatory protein [Gammaproteobacteria bacterium]|nr:AlpA family phage regulatory protein [Gammaproteobacteria bacterium]
MAIEADQSPGPGRCRSARPRQACLPGSTRPGIKALRTPARHPPEGNARDSRSRRTSGGVIRTCQRAVRRRELRKIVPLADTTIYEMERRGEFPRRFYLTSKCVVWDLDEVEQWLTARARSMPVWQRTAQPLPERSMSQASAVPICQRVGI